MTLYNELAAGSSKLINSAGETTNVLGSVSNTIKTIDLDSENLLDGNKFWAGTVVYAGATTADDTLYLLGIVSAATTLMTFKNVQISSSAAITVIIELYEDVATATNSGNVTSYNMNRNFTTTGTFVVNDAPAAITAAGTLLPPTEVIKSTTEFGYTTAATAQYVMKNNTKYVLKITNYGVATAKLTFFWLWTEF